jgi:hypothetical protein
MTISRMAVDIRTDDHMFWWHLRRGTLIMLKSNDPIRTTDIAYTATER